MIEKCGKCGCTYNENTDDYNCILQVGRCIDCFVERTDFDF
jgi:hypothetical protein